MEVQVAASNCDAIQNEGTGNTTIGGLTVNIICAIAANGRSWGGMRWSSGSFPVMGDVITVCYIKVNLTTSGGMGDDPRLYWHFELATSPAVFAAVAWNITSRTRTASSVYWDANGLGTGWKNSPSLVTPMQELIDSYSPTDIVAIGRPNTDVDNRHLYPYSYDSSAVNCPILHLEWTAPGGTAGKSANIGAKMIAGKLI